MYPLLSDHSGPNVTNITIFPHNARIFRCFYARGTFATASARPKLTKFNVESPFRYHIEAITSFFDKKIEAKYQYII